MSDRRYRPFLDGDGEPDAAAADPISPGRLPATAHLAPRPPIVYRSARDDNGVADGFEAAAARADGSAGEALPDDVRARFEHSLDADLSHVRVHTGAASAEAAAAAGARAYTVGNDIHFAAGAYATRDPFGLHLLAHEVAHTVQQAGHAPAAQFKREVSSPGDSAELEADRAADLMMCSASATLAATPSAIARQKASDPGDVAADGEHHGVGGWVHAEIYEPLERDYQAWMRWGLGRSAELGAQSPGVGHVVGAIEGFVPYVLGSAGVIAVGVAQLVTPKTADDHMLFALTAGLGPIVAHAGEGAIFGVRYGTYYLKALLKRRPDLEAKLVESKLMPKVVAEVEQRASTVIRKVEGRVDGAERAAAAADAAPQTRLGAAPNPTKRPSLSRVMQATANEEAGRTGFHWLHKIARALGGADRPENLVAATEEANKIMRVFERMAEMAAKQGHAVDVYAEASVKEGTRVGHTLTYRITIHFEREVLRGGTNVLEKVEEVVLDGTLDLATRQPVPTGAANPFNKSFRIAAPGT